MSTFRFLLIAIASLAVLAGCHPKAKPVPIEGLELKKDELRKFEIKVPSNWLCSTERAI